MIGKHTILIGDVFAMLATLPDDHFHCVVTSPPYWALRDYGVEGQLGSEPTPEEYVAKMVAVFREVRRVLRPDGTCWVNLGDGYNAGTSSKRLAPKTGVDVGVGGWNDAEIDGGARINAPGLKPKDLVGIPWRFALAAQADGWWLRSDIIWHKPNPMPESVTDRPTKAHEYLFLLTKASRYYYDAEAVKVSAVYPNDLRRPIGSQGAWELDGRERKENGGGQPYDHDASRANLRSVWTVPTESFKGAHFATYPKKLIIPCIKAGTSEKGCCEKCGAPWERTVEKERVATRPGEETKVRFPRGWGAGDDPRTAAEWNRSREEVGNRDPERHVTKSVTTGWQAGCKCEAGIVPCRVLDPFLGSGTTAIVANLLWRDCIGIELNPEYAAMAERRIGMETRPGAFCDQSAAGPDGLFSLTPEPGGV